MLPANAEKMAPKINATTISQCVVGTTKDTIQKTLLQKTTPKLKLTEVQLVLVELLKSKILENNPGAKISDTYQNKWGKDLEKMMRLDGRSA